MKHAESLSQFTQMYPLQKTLRFELRPVGKTLEHLDLKNDEKRAAAYKVLKPVIDNYHKAFIDECLSNVKLDWKPLQDAFGAVQRDKHDPKTRKQLENIQKQMRKQIGERFTKSPKFKDLFEKALLEKLLPEFLAGSPAGMTDKQVDEAKEALSQFKGFSVYFTGFHETRQNLYSVEDHATAISFRIVHDNFPKFLRNIETYKMLAADHPKILEAAESELVAKSELGDVSEKGVDLADVFRVEYFNQVLGQQGIDAYNHILGGHSLKAGDRKVQGINECINLYKQQHPGTKIPNMVFLFKQILSDRESQSFIPQAFTRDDEVLESISTFYEKELHGMALSGEKVDVLPHLNELAQRLDSFDQSKLLISGKSLTEVSRLLFKDWGKLGRILEEYASVTYKTKKAKENFLKAKEFSFQDLNEALKQQGYSETLAQAWALAATDKQDSLKEMCKLEYIEEAYEEVKVVLQGAYGAEKPLREQEDDIEKLKQFLDALMAFQRWLEPLYVRGAANMDPDFAGQFDLAYERLFSLIPLYNKVRNYLTQARNEAERFKLRLDVPTLADGWDQNKELANGAIILLKDEQYYLGIMNPKRKPDFSSAVAKPGEETYQKMVYKYFIGVTKTVPKCTTQMKAVKEHFGKTGDAYELDGDNFIRPLVITKEIYDLNNKLYGTGVKKFQIGYSKEMDDAAGFKDALKKWIGFCIEFLRVYRSTADLDFSTIRKPEEYVSYDEFIKDTDRLRYRMKFEDVSTNVIHQWVDAGKLFLFQIYNKDFAPGSTGRPNMHTLYWKQVFSSENLANVVVKLNGEAELFYRRPSIIKPYKHKVGEKLLNRTAKDGASIPKEVSKVLFDYANGRIKSLSDEVAAWLPKAVIKDVKHEITKDRRFTKPQFAFHVPLTFNFKADSAADNQSRVNQKVWEYLLAHDDTKIIGIDRGERNLLYVTLINREGEILSQKSYNVIGGMDYHGKLVEREQSRDKARKSWQRIGQIKNLKEGYLSLVIHEIAQMMVEHNAIVVMEDLNRGFKRGRFGVERQVYQKFEKMLIDKLNYLVFKDCNPQQPGGVLNAYQLTSKVTSYDDIGRQTGFLFYVPAAYTSKIDPTTGYTSLVRFAYENEQKAKALLKDAIPDFRYSSSADEFEIEVDHSKVKTHVKDPHAKWTLVATNEKRYAFTKKDGQPQTMSLHIVDELKALFTAHEVPLNGKNMMPAILQVQGAAFFDRLFWLLRVLTQMRYSNSATGEDYILSPVKNRDGVCFDSRRADDLLPKDADANGAFHIALKGLQLLNACIRENAGARMPDSPFSVPNITLDDWLKFAQDRTVYGINWSID